MTRDIFCFTGYPASGKSAACDIAAEHGAMALCMGDIVREKAAEALGDNPTSTDIGEWATQERDKHGDEVFAEYTSEYIIQTDANTVAIDGIRSPEEATVFRERFGCDNVTVIYIHAPFDARLQRLVDRGREDEGAFTVEDLEQRDAREEGWGLRRLVDEEMYDVIIENDGSFEDFSSNITDIIPQPTKAANKRAS